jgi:PAS domain S-box-containing protein
MGHQEMASTIELAARLSAVVAMQQEMLSAIGDPERVMELAVNRTPEVTNGNGAVVELVEGDELVYRAASGAARAQLGLRLSANNSLSGQAVREGRPLRCDNVDLDTRVDGAACRAIGIRSMIIAPLTQKGKAVGALKSFSAEPNAFDDLDSYTLQLLAGMTSAALMHAREFRERQASEQRYRMLFERNVAGVFRTTIDGRILDCNDALAGFLGYASREELLTRETWDLYEERSDRERFLSKLKADHALTNLRIHLRKKDGSKITGIINASLIPAEDGGVQVLGTMVEES